VLLKSFEFIAAATYKIGCPFFDARECAVRSNEMHRSRMRNSITDHGPALSIFTTSMGIASALFAQRKHRKGTLKC